MIVCCLVLAGCLKANSEIGFFEEENVFDLRKDEKAFEWFLDNICTAVMGVAKAEQQKTMVKPSEWMTAGIEAFSLLCYQNYLEMVRSQVDNQETPVPPKWTADGRGRKRNQGWDKSGIARYNQLRSIVQADRDSTRGKTTEAKYLEKKRKDSEALEERKLKRKRDALEARERDLTLAEDDFSDDDDDNSVAAD
jgi:hypothetical protein